jgi:N-methylhydantoinase B/oxoprolinase/acetone carboxylase alpha subunit
VGGNAAGQPFEITVARADGSTERVPGKTHIALFAGDCVIMKTSGGGGYGAPAPTAVADSQA